MTFRRILGSIALSLAVLVAPGRVRADYSFTRIADTSGPISSFGGASINNSGTVAFYAKRDGGGDGIYSGSGECRDDHRRRQRFPLGLL